MPLELKFFIIELMIGNVHLFTLKYGSSAGFYFFSADSDTKFLKSSYIVNRIITFIQRFYYFSQKKRYHITQN